MAEALLRWAGSKRKLIPTLRRVWGAGYDRYIEPFAGSACFFFDLEPGAAIIGDINSDLIQTYEMIRADPDEVHGRFVRIENSPSEYYRIRQLQSSDLSPFDRAARFLYLNRYCFNGLYRTNAQGRFNVPYGGGRSGQPPALDSFRRAGTLLKRARLVAGDFEQVLAEAVEGDFVYIDPPYRVSGRRVFREYDQSSFTKSDLRRLRGCLEELRDRRVHFLVSYAESAEARLLGQEFFLRRVRVRRNIAGFASDRRVASELLISNIPNLKGEGPP